jgi:hypothetical protein
MLIKKKRLGGTKRVSQNETISGFVGWLLRTSKVDLNRF